MMPWDKFIPQLAVMAVVTYLIRMLPLAFFRKKITNVFFRSFLYYVPFAVLGAMTFPSVLNATGNLWTSLLGTGVALFLGFKGKSLLTVAASACAAAFLLGLFLH